MLICTGTVDDEGDALLKKIVFFWRTSTEVTMLDDTSHKHNKDFAEFMAGLVHYTKKDERYGVLHISANPCSSTTKKRCI